MVFNESDRVLFAKLRDDIDRVDDSFSRDGWGRPVDRPSPDSTLFLQQWA